MKNIDYSLRVIGNYFPSISLQNLRKININLQILYTLLGYFAVAFFILPPVQIIADNHEVPKQVILAAQNYQKNFLQELNITNTVSKVTTGAYSGTQVFNWDQKYNGILMTSLVFQKGKGFKNSFLRTATLLRQNDCTHLGSLWNYTDKKIISFPLENSNLNVSSFITRSFKTISPVKFDLLAEFSDKRFADVFKIVLMEEFSKKNVPVISDVGRFYCKAENLKDAKNEQVKEYPARPHRVVAIKITEKLQKGLLNKIDYEMQMNSAVFGQKSKDVFEKKEQEDFNPQKISENLAQKILPKLDDLSQAEFQIIKRVGSWVYLNRGRAYGLTIGMRLVGPHKSTLHIIRYAPELDGELDGSIAFIRHENNESPLVSGDTLKLDQKLYPK